MSNERRVAIISGAGKGLGRAYAHHLAAQGVAIVVNNRRHANDVEPSADRVAREIREAGGHAVANHGAAEDPTTGEALLEKALTTFGRLDIVIANAGVSEAATFSRQDAAQFARTVDINLMGTAYLLLPTFRYLYAQSRGHVLLSTSAAGLFGEHGLPAYSAAKAGLIGLMRSLASEGRSHKVYVNAIAPFARTQMTDDTLRAAAVDGLAPEDVAPIAAALVDAGSAITGEVIIAGGGRLARASVHAGAPRALGATPTPLDDLHALLEQSPGNSHSGAVAMFRDFVA
jgi:NAD(P)-dependent dehydrogenase (short-subunit alcohol dehydrogenase family)